MGGILKTLKRVGLSVLGVGAAGHVAASAPALGVEVGANFVASIHGLTELMVAFGTALTALAVVIEKFRNMKGGISAAVRRK